MSEYVTEATGHVFLPEFLVSLILGVSGGCPHWEDMHVYARLDQDEPDECTVVHDGEVRRFPIRGRSAREALRGVADAAGAWLRESHEAAGWVPPAWDDDAEGAEATT